MRVSEMLNTFDLLNDCLFICFNEFVRYVTYEYITPSSRTSSPFIRSCLSIITAMDVTIVLTPIPT